MVIKRVEVFQLRYGLHEEKYAWSGGHSVDSFLTTIVKLTTNGNSSISEGCRCKQRQNFLGN